MASKRNRHLRAVEGNADEFRAAANALADRLVWAKMLGMTHAGKRDVYGVLGYDELITAKQYRDRYARGGIAGRVIDALAKAAWRGDGDLFEDEDPEVETPFEKDWDALNEQHDVWSTLCRAHIQASLASFSVILIGAVGRLDTPLPKGKPGAVLYVKPFGGGIVNPQQPRASTASGAVDADVIVDKWDEDSESPRFGKPLTYLLKRTNFITPGEDRPVHWTRMVHVPAIGFLDDDIYGPPGLEDVWNYLIDLDKVVGGGAEAFWLRANQGTHLNVDKKMTFANAGDREAELARLAEQADKYAHQQTRMLRTTGVDVKALGSDVADFKNPMDALVTLIAGTKGIPKRILTGSEMGQLASEQDRDNWNDQVKDCRKGYALPTVLRPFVNRLIEYGYLTKPKQWEPMWPDEEAMSEPEKMAAAKGMAETNDHGSIIFTSAEIREYVGYEPLSDEDIADELKVREAVTAADKEDVTPDAPDAEDILDEENDPEAEVDTEEEQIDKIAAALKHGGTVNITVVKE